MLATIITILGTLVPTILQNSGVIGPKVGTLIANLMGPVSTLLAGIGSGQSKSQDALAALGAMQGVITVLEADTSLPAALLTQLGNIAADIKAALAAYMAAEKGFDLTVYQQISTVS